MERSSLRLPEANHNVLVINEAGVLFESSTFLATLQSTLDKSPIGS